MPLYPPSKLDQHQIFQHAFDEVNQRLRTDATLNIGGGGVEVMVSHLNDSIRLGDGTDFLTTTTVGSDVGLDVNVLNLPIGTTPTVVNLSMPVSGTEYSFAIPTNTRKIEFSSRKNGKIQYAYTVGGTSTLFKTVSPGVVKEIGDVNVAAGKTLYVVSTKATDTLEIEYWT